MGSGKNYDWTSLAEMLGWEFVDLDEEIERQEGTSIREIFSERGEPEFREIEHSAAAERVWLRARAARCLRWVAARLRSRTMMQLLKRAGVRTVFLEVPLEEMLRRCCATRRAESHAATGG